MRKLFLLIGILQSSVGCLEVEPIETFENENTPIENIISTNENTDVITITDYKVVHPEKLGMTTGVNLYQNSGLI